MKLTATLVSRDGRRWPLERDTAKGVYYIHRTRYGNVYAILPRLAFGRPFRICRLLNQEWIPWEGKLGAGGTNTAAILALVLRIDRPVATATDYGFGDTCVELFPLFPPDWEVEPELLFDDQGPARRRLHMDSLHWSPSSSRNPAPAMVRRLQGGRQHRRRQIRKMRQQRM